jgi:hypothetical protein
MESILPFCQNRYLRTNVISCTLDSRAERDKIKTNVRSFMEML